MIKLLGLVSKIFLTNKKGFGDIGNGIYGSGYQIYAMLLTISSIGVPNAIAKLIIYFLDKIEVEWSYTLGMYQLTQLWRSKDLKTIKYKAYDSTLRCLDGVKFKGSSEWRDILAINEYMSKCHNLYSIDTAWLYFLSGKHNAILDLLNKDKQPQPEQSQPEV